MEILLWQFYNVNSIKVITKEINFLFTPLSQPFPETNLHITNVILFPRIFYAFWIGYVFFLLAAYECNLRAYLMKTDIEAPINSVSDILRETKSLFIIRDSSFFIPFFKYSPLAEYRKIYAKIESEESYLTFERGSLSEESEKVLSSI